MKASETAFDVLVIGSGIAGLQSALDLADRGHQVAIVERNPSIGGAMIGLSKVFPTLDCASCITTPKMAAAAHHPRITLFTYTEVESIEGESPSFRVRLLQKARYVDVDKCIGCRLCEYACDVEVADHFEQGLGATRAIRIPFTNAIPQVAVLDPEACVLCGKCVKVCPTDAVILDQAPTSLEVEARSIIVATGWKLTPIDAKPQYGGGHIENVISPLQMERLLAPHGPYGRVLCPADGKVPDSIAFVQCAGSRDRSIGVPYCSRVCCMYAIKQAMLLSGAVPLADITIYYMDIRAFGKGYEEFFQTAKAMGVQFVKAKVARLTENEDRTVTARIERVSDLGQVEEARHDLVVLSLGMLPGDDPSRILPLQLGSDGFLDQPHPKDAPCNLGHPGLYVAGTATGPKDIVDSIIEASAAAMEASRHLGDGEAAERSTASANQGES